MERYLNSSKLAFVAQAAFVVLSGGVLSILVARSTPLIGFAVVGIAVLVTVFLARPDVALILVLVLRSSTDALGLFSSPTVELSAAAMPVNAVLILALIFSGGFFLFGRKGVRLINLPGGKLLILLLFLGLVALLRSDRPLAGLSEWLALVSTLVAYGLAANLFDNQRKVLRVVLAIGVSLLVPAGVAIKQALSGEGFVEAALGIVRVNGTFAHPNAFGVYLVLILSVFLAQFLVATGWRKGLGLAISCAGIALAVMTYARASWVGALIVIVVFGILKKRSLLIASLALPMLLIYLVPGIGARLADPLSESGSLADRIQVWTAALSQWSAITSEESTLATILNRLSGIGPGAAAGLTTGFRGLPWAIHNDYLRVLFEYGLIGLLLYMALVLVLMILAFRTWRQVKGSTGENIALAFLALTIAYPVMSLTDNVFGATQNQVYFWTLAGLTAAIGASGRAQKSVGLKEDRSQKTAGYV